MAKHIVTWQWEGDFEFDTDHTAPELIAQDFVNACEEGLEFTRGDTVDFSVIEVDGEHVHAWIDSYFGDEQLCGNGCGERRRIKPVMSVDEFIDLPARVRVRARHVRTVHLPGDAPEERVDDARD